MISYSMPTEKFVDSYWLMAEQSTFLRIPLRSAFICLLLQLLGELLLRALSVGARPGHHCHLRCLFPHHNGEFMSISNSDILFIYSAVSCAYFMLSVFKILRR